MLEFPSHRAHWEAEVERNLRQQLTWWQQLWKRLTPTGGQIPLGTRALPVFGIASQSSTGILFRNDSGQTVPAHAVMRITGAVTLTVNGLPTPHVTIAQPNTFGCQYQVLVNGPVDVPVGATGSAQERDPFAVKFETADGTPAFGEYWGPRNGEWALRKNTGGFQIVGNPANGVVRARHAPWLTFTGVAAGQLSVNASGAVTIYMGPQGAETSTGVTTSAYNRYATIAAGKRVDCTWHGNGFQVCAAEC